MAGAVQSVRVSIRSSADRSEVSLPWELATTEVLASAAPWRTFRWHKGQRHYSGTYWSATEHGHVIYESRLELARLLFADFDTSVKRIIAQPFLLSAQVEATVRRHELQRAQGHLGEIHPARLRINCQTCEVINQRGVRSTAFMDCAVAHKPQGMQLLQTGTVERPLCCALYLLMLVEKFVTGQVHLA
jgi:hypothetical protein